MPNSCRGLNESANMIGSFIVGSHLPRNG